MILRSDEEILNALRKAAKAEKRIIAAAGWKQGQRERELKLSIALQTPKDLIAGLELRGNAILNQLDKNVTFQVTLDIRGQIFRLERIDWRPQNPHVNRFGPPGLRGLSVESAYHSFDLNSTLDLETIVRGNLPIAKPLNPEPNDFNELLISLREYLSIMNAEEIMEPPWSPTLL